ncbi:hypothetical protein K440DRAFT_631784, partial [Wilcoxina mikolae CBS 423.85]
AAAVVAAEELHIDAAPEMTLPPHRSIDHAIDSGHKLPYGRTYYLSEVESRTLKTYIETNLANGIIQRGHHHRRQRRYFCKEGRRLETLKLTTELSTRAQSRIGNPFH